MRYLSIDLETTGSDPLTCQIIEFAAVLEDTEKPEVPVEELPYLRLAVHYEILCGNVAALAMNARLLQEIADAEQKNNLPPDHCQAGEVLARFAEFLDAHQVNRKRALLAAGKNFASFDLPFIHNLPGYGELLKISNAVIDPALLYLDWHNDRKLPNMSTCKERAGLSDIVSHQALDDARDIVRLLRPFYKKFVNPGQQGEEQ
ncbi:3'-5' exonuclease [Cesiribacter sp. SM1]|uniref:3'-5' exonuclease n=1 Tax=Cesiribacter sp. SM1 TaxID=2861196 RepID=UPI001CD4D340|nr:3'-5' exonuclease [Cesiribacter sp. SM1]